VYKTLYVWLDIVQFCVGLLGTTCHSHINRLQHTPEYKHVVSNPVKHLPSTFTMPCISCSLNDNNHYHPHNNIYTNSRWPITENKGTVKSRVTWQMNEIPTEPEIWRVRSRPCSNIHFSSEQLQWMLADIITIKYCGKRVSGTQNHFNIIAW